MYGLQKWCLKNILHVLSFFYQNESSVLDNNLTIEEFGHKFALVDNDLKAMQYSLLEVVYLWKMKEV